MEGLGEEEHSPAHNKKLIRSSGDPTDQTPSPKRPSGPQSSRDDMCGPLSSWVRPNTYMTLPPLCIVLLLLFLLQSVPRRRPNVDLSCQAWTCNQQETLDARAWYLFTGGYGIHIPTLLLTWVQNCFVSAGILICMHAFTSFFFLTNAFTSLSQPTKKESPQNYTKTKKRPTTI